jgi:hypothetical protein
VKTLALLISIVGLLPAQEAVILPRGGALEAVYIVSRATSAESRALFSARLLTMDATKLYWYDAASVVRAEMPSTSLEALRADSDVVLVLSETNEASRTGTSREFSPHSATPYTAELVPTAALVSTPALQVAASPPLKSACPLPDQASGVFSFAPPPVPPPPPMPVGGMAPMGAPPPGGMPFVMPGVGLIDSLAGGVARHLLNRPPSCKISLARAVEKFEASGGDGVIEVNASGSCSWQAQSSVSWIKILSGFGVSGSGIITYSVDPADGKNRLGAIWITTSPGGSPVKGNASYVVTQTK